MHCIKINNAEISKVRRLGLIDEVQLLVSPDVRSVSRKGKPKNQPFCTFIYRTDRTSGVMGKIFPPPRVHVRQHKCGRWASAASRLGAFHSGFRYIGIPLRKAGGGWVGPGWVGPAGGGFQFACTGGAAGSNCCARSHTFGALV